MNQKLANTDYDEYSYTYMKTRLQEHFGERIVQTEINGKPNIITFRTTATAVLQNYYSKQQQEKENTTEEKIKLGQAAAKLIKEYIKAIGTSHEIYPLCDDLKSEEAGIEYLPDTLRVLLEELFAGKKAGIKVASMGQAMMQATRQEAWWKAWRPVEVSHKGMEWLKISTYCGCCQGLPVQKLIS